MVKRYRILILFSFGYLLLHEILECCAEDTNYRIFFEFKNGTAEEMLEIDHKLRFMLKDQQ